MEKLKKSQFLDGHGWEGKFYFSLYPVLVSLNLSHKHALFKRINNNNNNNKIGGGLVRYHSEVSYRLKDFQLCFFSLD